NTDAHVPPGSPASRGATVQAVAAPAGPTARDHSSETDGQEQVLSSSGASPDIRYFGEVIATAASAPAEPRGVLPGPPQSGRGDAVELLLRGRARHDRWVTPDTRASEVAPYLAEWKRKVERVGTLNFPSAARRAGLSGSPVVEVEIAANGRLRHAEVRRSSGYGALDQAALTILRLASPFNPFPADLAAEYSRLRFAYQWDFESGSLTSATVPAARPDSAVPAASAPLAPVDPATPATPTTP